MRNPFAPALLPLFLAAAVITSTRIQAQEPEPGSASQIRSTSAHTAPIQDALSSLQTILDQSRKAGDRKAEANTLGAIANSYNALRQQQKAIEQFQSARTIWKGLGDREHEATTVAHIGDVYRGWGFPEQANRYYRDALGLYPSTDKAERGATLNNLSLTYFSLNNRKKCVETLNEALSIFRELHDRRSEALALANLGTAYVFMVNDPMKAIDILQQAVTKLEVLNDRASEAEALDKMGVAWHNLGKSEMAGLSFQHALQLFHAVGDTQGETSVRKHMRALDEQQAQASSR